MATITEILNTPIREVLRYSEVIWLTFIGALALAYKTGGWAANLKSVEKETIQLKKDIHQFVLDSHKMSKPGNDENNRPGNSRRKKPNVNQNQS